MTTTTKKTKLAKMTAKSTTVTAGRVYGVAASSLPRVDAQAKARLEDAARKPSIRRDYPEIA
jgi:hypothetical protein